MSAHDEHLLAYVTGLGDNALILGQRLGELVTRAPELEEEMANANFALDYIGQARLFYTYAGQLDPAGRSEDDFAYLRDGADFRNVLLVEQPNGDFAMTVARQFLFESFYLLQLQALSNSSATPLAEIAARAEKEIRYHVRHQRQWLIRLGDGTAESHSRMQHAIDELWRFTGELFTPDVAEAALLDAGISADVAALQAPWAAAVGEALATATLTQPGEQWMASGGKQGTHSEHLGYLLAEMQCLPRAYPGATW